MPTGQEIDHIIKGCIKLQRESQKELYTLFYGYAMSVCSRYTQNQQDTLEVTNDGFLKVFRELGSFKARHTNTEACLKGWIRQIMIHTAIDHFRKNNKYPVYLQPEEHEADIEYHPENIIDKMSYDEIMQIVQQLSPIYRATFNLYVIDGYKHEEIAKQLNISVGTSKSNLARARIKIQKMLKQAHIPLYEQRAI